MVPPWIVVQHILVGNKATVDADQGGRLMVIGKPVASAASALAF